MMVMLASKLVMLGCSLETSVHLDLVCKDLLAQENLESLAVETKLDYIQDCNHCQQVRIQQLQVSLQHQLVTKHPCRQVCHLVSMESFVVILNHCSDLLQPYQRVQYLDPSFHQYW